MNHSIEGRTLPGHVAVTKLLGAIIISQLLGLLQISPLAAGETVKGATLSSTPFEPQQLPAVQTPPASIQSPGNIQPISPISAKPGVKTGSPIQPKLQGGPVPGINQGGPQPEPPTRPQPVTAPPAGSAMLPLPAGGHLAQPGSGPSAPPRHAGEIIRETAANLHTRPTIERIMPDELSAGCVANSMTLQGRRFGERAEGRQVVLLDARSRRPIAGRHLVIHRWSEGRISVSLSERRNSLGLTTNIAIVDATGNPISNTDEAFRPCPSAFQISGEITLTNCHAAADQILLNVSAGSSFGTIRPVRLAGGGDRFRYQYSMSQPVSAITLRPNLTSAGCPRGAWLPERIDVATSYAQPNVVRNLEYRVTMLEQRINMDLLALAVDAAFRGTAIHINNFDSSTQSWRADDAFIRLPADLGGREIRWSMEPFVMSPRRYFVNDINLARTAVTRVGGELKIHLTFETNGMEFIGQCSDDFGCIAGAPDVQAELEVDIFLTPDRFSSAEIPVGLSYGNLRVVARPNAHADGLCLVVDGICNAFTDYRDRIRRGLEANIQSALDNNQRRRDVARALQAIVDALDAREIVSVEVVGVNLVMRYLPAS
jgi:hypothetical protein